MSFPLPASVFEELESSTLETNNARIEAVEAKLLDLPQIEAPLRHIFAPGVYYREITMEAGCLVIGHEHKTEHLNIITEGSARVMIDGELHVIRAPHVFISKPGVRKVLLIDERMVWSTVHPTNETDLQKLEEELINKSASFTAHLEDAKKLQQAEL